MKFDTYDGEMAMKVQLPIDKLLELLGEAEMVCKEMGYPFTTRAFINYCIAHYAGTSSLRIFYLSSSLTKL